MSNFMKQGQRQVKLAEKKNVKRHLKGFYRTIELISEVAQELIDKGVEVTEDNVEALAKDIMGRDIDNMEKFLILGKVNTPNIGME